MLLRIIAFAIVVSISVAAPRSNRADETSRQDVNGRATSTSSIEADAREKPIERSSLPLPPPELAELIERGDVHLVTGGLPQSNPDTLPIRGRLAGETRFRFRYRYDSRASWRLLPANDRSQAAHRWVELTVRFRSLRWIVDHEVWLLEPPPAKDFWDDPVVLHEFDHVRLSTAPQIKDQFMKAAKRLRSIRVPLQQIAEEGRVDSAKVRSLIEAHMHDALVDTTDYVRIRYRELDRLTEHGLRPLPEDPGLIEIE